MAAATMRMMSLPLRPVGFESLDQLELVVVRRSGSQPGV
jgi:hypothetical protein